MDDLRPPALDDLGLIGALRQRAEQLAWRADGTAVGVRLVVPVEVPNLRAAVEVATYRITTEALTNVVRRSRAGHPAVRRPAGVRISDNGSPGGAWTAGVGLSAMRERAVELGGSFEAGPSPEGGRIRGSIPLTAV